MTCIYVDIQYGYSFLFEGQDGDCDLKCAIFKSISVTDI